MRITPSRIGVLALLCLANACVTELDGTAEGASSICDDADLVPEVCAEIADSAAAADETADEAPRMRGIVVERSGNRTYFKIPLAYTVGGDQRRLLDETIHTFGQKIGELNQDMIDRGIDLTALVDEADRQEFEDNYIDTIHAVFDTNLDDRMATELGDSIEDPRTLHVWNRYVVPQAFVAYFGTKFSVNIGIGGGVSATVMIVAQPWLSLGVDHTSGTPTVIDKRYELDVAVMGIPNVDVGFGTGGGIPIRVGVGAVFGPLDHPNDLAGWGAGLSASGTLPVIGGGQAKVVTVLHNPPLILAMLGYNSGTAGGWEVHGNLQRIMDLGAFLDWIGGIL